MDYTAWSSDDGYDDMDGSIHEVDLNESNLLSLSITQDTEIKILEETLKKQNEEMEKMKKENEDLRKELCRFAKVDTKDEQTQTDAEEEVVNSTFQEAICDRYSYVWQFCVVISLTHWGRDKMAVISRTTFSRTTFSNAFLWMMMY